MIIPVILLLVVSLLAAGSGANTTTTNNNNNQKPTREQWQEIKSGLRSNRESMCSFLLDDAKANGDEDPLSLDKVVALFERSLDHLAKASEYVAKMRPHVEPKAVSDFDENGRWFVLEVSNARLDLIREYEEAQATRGPDGQPDGGQVEREILERYFYKACTSKLGTILAEKSMYDAAKKVERRLAQQLQIN